HRANVDHRIETVEPALARLRVILPPATNVLLVDQFAAGKQRLGFCRQRGNFIRIEHVADDQKAIVVIRADLLWRNASHRWSANRHGTSRSEWTISYDQMIVRILVAVSAPRKPPL